MNSNSTFTLNTAAGDELMRGNTDLLFLLGSIAPIAPTQIPASTKLANPHNAYVAIISERGCRE